MPRPIRAFLASTAAFLIIDGLWLSVFATDFYADGIGHLMRDKVKWGGAVAFYALYLAGVFALIVQPALMQGRDKGALFSVIWRAGLLGALCYGTYDLTNYAVLRDWPLLVTVVDVIWGTLLTSAVASAGFLAGRPAVSRAGSQP